MSELLLIPLDDVVVFPNMTATLSVDAGDESKVLLVPRHEDTYAAVKDEIDARPVRELTVKGREKPVMTYEVLGIKGEAQPPKSMKSLSS